MNDLVVETSLAKLRGTIIEGITAFKAVPYAATQRRARFLPPRAVDGLVWHSRRGGLRGPGHLRLGCAGYSPGTRNVLRRTRHIPGFRGCLTLHVWSARTTDGETAGEVWLHGGAFSYGSAKLGTLRGSRLARPWRWSSLSCESPSEYFWASRFVGDWRCRVCRVRNVALLDLIAALNWVRNNYRPLGGIRN